MIERFREEVYQSFEQRADAGMDLLDALSSAVVVESPVALSESPLFRRKFSSVYDVLENGRMQWPRLRRVLARNQPEDAETIAGFEVYAVDCTDDPVADAETLEDRMRSKKGKHASTQVVHRYSWLVRLVTWRTSWCMPLDIRRVPTQSTDSQVGSEQVADLAAINQRLKVVVADSLYCNVIFLSIFLGVQNLFALVRMRSNCNLYEEPPEREPGQRGRTRIHGPQVQALRPLARARPSGGEYITPPASSGEGLARAAFLRAALSSWLSHLCPVSQTRRDASFQASPLSLLDRTK